MAAQTAGALPLVSVLIPTYNRPVFFERALKSVLAQTYKNIEIIIGDDSTNDETQTLVRGYARRAPNIRYEHNRPKLGGVDNFRRCQERARGQFLNYLMDDDLFHPQKIETMAKVLQNFPDVSMVTSRRGIVDENDKPGKEVEGLGQVVQGSKALSGIEVGDLCLRHGRNLIGEPTTVMFRRSMLVEPFGMCGGRQYGCNSDMASWLVLMSQGRIAFVDNILSFLRVHDGQLSNTFNMFCHGVSDMLHQLSIAEGMGFLQNPADFLAGAEVAVRLTSRVIKGVAEGGPASQLESCGLNDHLQRVMKRVSELTLA